MSNYMTFDVAEGLSRGDLQAAGLAGLLSKQSDDNFVLAPVFLMVLSCQ